MYTKKVLSMFSKTLLIVDDMPFYLKMTEDCFRREQINIITAQSGREALAVIKSNKPDLVLMDLYMKDGDGDATCIEIKSDDEIKSTPIIIMTSSENKHDIERCLKSGCDDFIHKPFTRENLLNLSRRYVKFARWSGERLKINVKVKYGNDDQMLLAGSLGDMSVGGIFLETEELMPIGVEVYLRFQLSQESSPIQCKGKVSWLNRKINLRKGYAAGMGIEFVDIKKMEILAIQAWMAKNKEPIPANN